MPNINLDIEFYNDLVESIYEAAQNKSSWSEPLEELRKLFSANYVTLILKQPLPDDETGVGIMIAVGGDLDDDSNIQYLPYGHTLTPFNDQEPNKIVTVDDLMDEQQWIDSSYRRHWCMHNDVYHVMAVDISIPDVGNLPFRITRGETDPAFSIEDKALCQFFVSHLRRALEIHLQLNRSESLGSMYSQAIGRLSIATIKIDEQGKVLDQNIFAREIIEAGDGLRIVCGKLTATSSSDNRELKHLVKGAFERARNNRKNILPEAMSVSRPSCEVNLGIVVEVIPGLDWAEGKGQAQAIIYIRDSVSKSQASSDMAKKLFGLTPAETALSLQLTNGLSLEEASEALNIRRNTARAHLRAIFSKTGVRRQTELVRIFLNSVAALGYSHREAKTTEHTNEE
ncbi:transcriptional regulator, LuxR family [Shewanella halifaxensis HAW-EB4]|uniref:Transcriptional regulator, LuxR family n=1 Tax=Shewanella halifaxensis (strain HAW-EB4) TaxID=458817 RepID=B0TTU8_SHEHH|nr:helix-turn-helix transcriptional regulator [Shewanella halifaxensis]ABZ76666.1 transcriptional regulator, LuxR family [Shewanella halifaxensis HAW-EB4]